MLCNLWQARALVWKPATGRADERAGVSADPVQRWLYPEPQQYLAHSPEFLAAFGLMEPCLQIIDARR